ncbi:MAG: hypothetical protein LBP41_02390 [Holosporaceae bacterium]|nr:hypothetical protein [Holosporaceae bacterium]
MKKIMMAAMCLCIFAADGMSLRERGQEKKRNGVNVYVGYLCPPCCDTAGSEEFSIRYVDARKILNGQSVASIIGWLSTFPKDKKETHTARDCVCGCVMRVEFEFPLRCFFCCDDCKGDCSGAKLMFNTPNGSKRNWFIATNYIEVTNFIEKLNEKKDAVVAKISIVPKEACNILLSCSPKFKEEACNILLSRNPKLKEKVYNILLSCNQKLIEEVCNILLSRNQKLKGEVCDIFLTRNPKLIDIEYSVFTSGLP